MHAGTALTPHVTLVLPAVSPCAMGAGLGILTRVATRRLGLGSVYGRTLAEACRHPACLSLPAMHPAPGFMRPAEGTGVRFAMLAVRVTLLLGNIELLGDACEPGVDQSRAGRADSRAGKTRGPGGTSAVFLSVGSGHVGMGRREGADV
ncbi:hypothetical protein C8J57DRAFT_1230881 [Mycena rebaudengoi]|nr:hypothetical protein C8J57DRAFT_1230881 [Mycena rebaudengoi]